MEGQFLAHRPKCQAQKATGLSIWQVKRSSSHLRSLIDTPAEEQRLPKVGKSKMLAQEDNSATSCASTV